MRESLEILDHVRLNFTPSSLIFLNIALSFVMFGVALDIKFENFEEIIRKPKSALVGIISQTFLLPAFTFLLVLLLNPTPTIALGMILVAACPGGNISNFISSMARGNVALAISLTAISTSMAVFFTPFNFAFWGGFYIDFYNAHTATGIVATARNRQIPNVPNRIYFAWVTGFCRVACSKEISKIHPKDKKAHQSRIAFCFLY